MTHIVDTFGWDLVFATTFDAVNQGISSKKSTPSGTYCFESVSKLAWSDWTLIEGGDGDNLHMLLPVKSGEFNYNSKQIDLSAVQVTIEVKLQYLKTSNDTNSKRPLVVNQNTVSVLDATGGNDVPEAILTTFKDYLSTFLNTHLGEFTHAFAVVDLFDELDQKDVLAWMRPTALNYAVSDVTDIDGNHTHSIFAILAMTNHRSADRLASQVDGCALIPSDTQNSALLISSEMVFRYMLLPSFANNFANGVSQDDFLFDAKGQTLTNNKDIVFSSVDIPKVPGKKDVTIPSQGMNLAFHNGAINYSMNGIHFTFLPGITVSLDTGSDLSISWDKKAGLVFHQNNQTLRPSIATSAETIAVEVVLSIVIGLIVGLILAGLVAGVGTAIQWAVNLLANASESEGTAVGNLVADQSLASIKSQLENNGDLQKAVKAALREDLGGIESGNLAVDMRLGQLADDAGISLADFK